MPLALTAIAGSLFNPSTGAKITSGQLHITPQTFIINGPDLVSPLTVTIAIPATGDLSFSLVPSNGVPYTVEFDPDPASSKPRSLRSGYFKDTWLVPDEGPVDISTL